MEGYDHAEQRVEWFLCDDDLDIEVRGLLLQKLASMYDTKNILVGNEDEKDNEQGKTKSMNQPLYF